MLPPNFLLFAVKQQSSEAAVMTLIVIIIGAILSAIAAYNKAGNATWKGGLPHCPNCGRRISMKSSRPCCRSCGHNMVQRSSVPTVSTTSKPRASQVEQLKGKQSLAQVAATLKRLKKDGYLK